MNRSPGIATSTLVAVLTSVIGGVTVAQEQTSEDLSATFGNAEVISLATGYERALFDAPVTATIISRDEIRHSGARSLADLLQRVPGYYITSNDARSTQITVRGLTQRVLILVNNLPLYQGFLDSTQALHNVLLFDVERVEVTRGPGSALFGADAAAGIVNIITRTASSGPLAEVGAVGGNLDSRGVHGLWGTAFRDADLRIYGAYYETDFTDRALMADAQSNFDRILNTDASLAPGSINAARKILDTRASFSSSHWALRASHRNEYDFGTGTGLTYALDPTGSYDLRTSTVELVHQSMPSANWSLRGHLAGIQIDQKAQLHPYPAGAFRGLFPDGVRQSFDVTETRFRGELSGTYAGFRGHTLLLTMGGFNARYDSKSDVRNYVVRGGLVLPTYTFAPGAGVDDPKIIADANRDVWYFAAQDEWTPIPDWTFTLGARFDRYSDFGGTANPRAAVVWSPSSHTSVKLLYGTAFRPPSIIELQSNGTFAALGNPHLEPTKLSMTELTVTHRRAAFITSIGAFAYRQKDLVQTVPNVTSPTGMMFVNGASDRAWGLETSVEIRPTDRLSLGAHYTYQEHASASADNANAQQAPRHQISLALQTTPWVNWSANVFVLGILERGRARLDPRPSPANYALLNLTLERANLPGEVDLSIAIHNLLDHTVTDPSDSPAILPHDIPTPSRTWLAQLRKRF